jgi:hypothetical protein
VTGRPLRLETTFTTFSYANRFPALVNRKTPERMSWVIQSSLFMAIRPSVPPCDVNHEDLPAALLG